MGAGDAILSGKTTLSEVASTSRASGRVGTMAGVAEGRANEALVKGDSKYGFNANSFNDFIAGKERESAKQLGKTVGTGRANVSSDDYKASISAATGQFEESFRADAGYAKEAMKDGHITKNRARAVETSSAMKVASETESINRKFDKHYNPVEMAKQAARVAADQEIGKYNASLINQKKFGDGVYEKVAASSELNQVAGAMGSIREVSGIQNLASLTYNQARVQTGISSRMMRTFGVGGLITAGFASQMASTEGTLRGVKALGGVSKYADTMAYMAEQKAIGAGEQVKQDLSAGLAEIRKDKKTHVSSLGKESLSNIAVQNSVMGIKSAELKAKAASVFNAVQFEDKGAREATLKEYGLTEADVANGGKNMSDAALRRFLQNQEKRMEKMEISILDGHGNIATATARTMLLGDSSSGYTYKARLEKQSSFIDTQTGKRRDDHTSETIGANVKNAVASTFGTTTLDVTEGIGVAVGTAWTANTIYGKIKDAKSFKETPLGKIFNKGRNNNSELEVKSSTSNPFNKSNDGASDIKNNSQPYEPRNTQNYSAQNHNPPPGYSQMSGESELAKRGFVLNSASDILQHSPNAVNQGESMLSRASSLESLEKGTLNFTKEHAGSIMGHIGHYLGRKIPFGVGTAITAGFAAEQAYSGDKIGAAMTAASGAAAAIPAIGTVASLAIDGAQIIMQTTGVMGKLNGMLDSKISSFAQPMPHVQPMLHTQPIIQPTFQAATMTPSGSQFVAMPAMTNPGVMQAQQLSTLNSIKQAMDYANQAAKATQNKTYEAAQYQAEIAKQLEKMTKKAEE
jgi:hypothetical protein